MLELEDASILQQIERRLQACGCRLRVPGL